MIDPFEDFLDSVSFVDGRGSARCMFKLWLLTGHLEDVFNVPPIDRAEFDCPLCIGRADLVLFHRDRSASVFEIAGPLDLSSSLAAIDKLRMSAVHLRFAGVAGLIRKFIAASVNGKGSERLNEASYAAGVGFYPLRTYAHHVNVFEKFLTESENGNG